MKQSVPEAVFASVLASALVLLGSQPMHAQEGRVTAGFLGGGTVTGRVVDSDGVPQMGALIQLLLPDVGIAASAMTDARGYYRIHDLQPGIYRLRASAALLLPAVRQRLQVRAGGRSIADLTLSTLMAAPEWLPAQRRTTSDEDEDWAWTLRSSATRPVLRVVQDSDPLSVSSSSDRHRTGRSERKILVEDNEGGFARGGTHQVFSMAHAEGGGAMLMSADFSGPRTPYPVGPSGELSAGWQNTGALGGVSRTAITYTSHPELMGAHQATGMQSAVLTGGERIRLGDIVQIDAGSSMRVFNLAGNAVGLEPFLRMSVHPGEGIVIAVSYSRAPGVTSLDDIDARHQALPVAFDEAGHLRLSGGDRQSLSATARTRHGGTVEAALYRENFRNPAISGSGLLPVGNQALADPTTQTFRISGPGYASSGIQFAVNQPLTDALSIHGEFLSGSALASYAEPGALLVDALSRMQAVNTIAASASLDGSIKRTGTRIHAGYRWQPAATVTEVGSYGQPGERNSYLHCRARQSLRALRGLPNGLDIVVDMDNLFAQGYRAYLSNDGRTVFLAQSPRVLQAGLSLSF